MNSPQTEPSRSAFWISVSFFTLTLVGIAWAGWSLSQWASDRTRLPVSHLAVHGERVNVSGHAVRNELLAQGPLPSLMLLDVDAVQHQVLQMPWVDHVAVRKSWPSRLDVHVVEYQPAAIWNHEAMLDPRGRLFRVPQLPTEPLLPQLSGAEGQEQQVLNMYQQMQALLQPAGWMIQSLTGDARRSWRLQLDNGVEARLGREQTMQRLERFIGLLQKLSGQEKPLPAYVDLRYDTGAAVFWAASEPEAKGTS